MRSRASAPAPAAPQGGSVRARAGSFSAVSENGPLFSGSSFHKFGEKPRPPSTRAPMGALVSRLRVEGVAVPQTGERGSSAPVEGDQGCGEDRTRVPDDLLLAV